MLILLWREGLNGWARRLLLIMVAGMVMLVGWYAAQHLLVSDVAWVFWVNTSPGDAVQMFYWSARKLGELCTMHFLEREFYFPTHHQRNSTTSGAPVCPCSSGIFS